MDGYQPIDMAPMDGTWILLRGRNSIGKRMIPVVAAYKPPGVTSDRGWVDSAGLRPVDGLAAYTAPGADGSPDWHPLP